MPSSDEPEMDRCLRPFYWRHACFKMGVAIARTPFASCVCSQQRHRPQLRPEPPRRIARAYAMRQKEGQRGVYPA